MKRVLMEAGVIGVVALSSCASEMLLAQRHESVRVCFQTNEALSAEENRVFEAALESAAGKPRAFKAQAGCDSGDTTPRLRFRPLAFNYASTGERIVKPLVSLASVASAVYFRYFFIILPLPEIAVSYEIQADAPTKSAPRLEFRSTKISFAGDESRQRAQVSKPLDHDLADRLDRLMPSKAKGWWKRP